MRSAVASIVAAGVLALGAVPTTLALADEDTTKQTAARDAAGPPDWTPAHGHDKTRLKGLKGADKRAEKAQALKDKRRMQASWSENEDKQGPPPWAKAHGKQDKAAKQARATAMRQWSACAARAEAKATEAEQREAKRSCEKPTPPGHAR